jgi:hypothetical protein
MERIKQFASPKEDQPMPPTVARAGRQAAFCVALATSAAAAWADDDAPRPPVTGRELAQALELPVGLDWSGVELRPALENLSRSNRLAMVLDRRVDPGQELDLSLSDIPLADALRRIAEDRQIGVSQFGPVAYFGPEGAARALRTVAALRKEAVDGLSSERRKLLLKRRAWGWADLDEPRALIAALAKEGRCQVAGLEQVPHDLWAAASLPPLTLVERLSLVLIQFDLTFQLEDGGKVLKLEPIGEGVAIERSFPGGAEPEALAGAWRKLLPDCRIERAGNRIVVRGRVEDLERIESGATGAGTRTTVTGQGDKNYTLTVKNLPLGGLLDQLARKMKLEIQLDEAAIERAGIGLEQKVSFAVKEVTFDELFKALLGPAGLAHRRMGDKVEIFPAAAPE